MNEVCVSVCRMACPFTYKPVQLVQCTLLPTPQRADLQTHSAWHAASNKQQRGRHRYRYMYRHALSSRDLPVGVSVPVFSLLFSSRRCARRRAQRTYSRRPLKDWCSLIESNRPKSAPEEDMVALCVLGCWGVRYWGVGGVAEERGRRARDGIGWIETEKRRGGSEERMMMCPSVRRGTREEWS